MKAFILFILISFSLATGHAQSKTYCDGWDDGYSAGYSYDNRAKGRMDPVFMVPICPIGSGNYDAGYSRGFSKGQEDYNKRYGDSDDNQRVIVRKQEDGDYCKGWDDGYAAGYIYHNQVNGKIEPLFTTPVCPAGIGEYKDGYNRGFDKGKRDFEKRNNIPETNDRPVIIEQGGNDGDFCDGWESGYGAGYIYENQVNGKMLPLFITPVCPTSMGSYLAGYDKGYKKGLEDFSKRR